MITVHIKDIIKAEEAIARWSSLQIPAPMAMTLGLLIDAILPSLEKYRELQQRLGRELEEYRKELLKIVEDTRDSDDPQPFDLEALKTKEKEYNKQLEETGQLSVELAIGKIKFSNFPKARIVPTGDELAGKSWLIEMDMDIDADFPVIEEAKPLKREKPNDQPGQNSA